MLVTALLLVVPKLVKAHEDRKERAARRGRAAAAQESLERMREQEAARNEANQAAAREAMRKGNRRQSNGRTNALAANSNQYEALPLVVRGEANVVTPTASVELHPPAPAASAKDKDKDEDAPTRASVDYSNGHGRREFLTPSSSMGGGADGGLVGLRNGGEPLAAPTEYDSECDDDLSDSSLEGFGATVSPPAAALLQEANDETGRSGSGGGERVGDVHSDDELTASERDSFLQQSSC